MGSPAACAGFAARYGTLALTLESVDGQWRITVTDAERNVALHRAREASLVDAKRCAQDLALLYQARQDGSATVAEEEFVGAPVGA